VYEHFKKYDVTPTLYAAPWFLTLYASQYPIGFVSRVMDMVLLEGMEIVFKVSWSVPIFLHCVFEIYAAAAAAASAVCLHTLIIIVVKGIRSCPKKFLFTYQKKPNHRTKQ